MDVATVAAAPRYLFLPLKDLFILKIGQQGKVARLVTLFRPDDSLEHHGNFLETLFLGHLGKLRVHQRIFVMFPACGCRQVLGRAADDAGGKRGFDLGFTANQKLEFPLCMLLLVICRLQEA